MEPYNIKRMFDQGARVSSDKMSLCAMLEEFQSLYPGRYTLPGENEIRAEITKLFGRPVMRTMQVVIMMRIKNGRGSNLPKQYVKTP